MHGTNNIVRPGQTPTYRAETADVARRVHHLTARLNRPKIYLATTTPRYEENRSIFVVGDQAIVILEIFKIF
jgi:hypothetical protein